MARWNLDAKVPPTTNDDNTDGYAVASRWVDQVADKAYVCLDPVKAGAVWIETTSIGGGSGLWTSASGITKLTTAEDLDIQQKEFIAAAIETLTAVERMALSPVAAQLCFDTDDNHLYINV